MSPKNLHANIRKLLLRQARMRRENAISLSLLQTLRFATMTARQETIADAHQRTFEWVFRDPAVYHKPWANFNQWLSCGNGIYWINGKAGSGKSTLMKLIHDHDKTEQELRIWRGNGALVTSTFFFWRSGDLDQRSHTGLLRSLLYESLSEHIDLIPRVFPEDWTKWYELALNNVPLTFSAWTLTKLKRAFQQLLCLASEELRF